MNNLQPYAWTEFFRISPEQVSSWKTNLPQNKSLVRWAIESGKISAELYLDWAQKHYRLPILNHQFSDLQTVAEIRLRYSNLWPDHVVPVGEWDGTLFLACLEPVPDFKAPQNHQWILADLHLILKLRGEEGSAAETHLPPPLPEGPAGLKIDLEATSNIDFSAPMGLNLSQVNPPNLGVKNLSEATTKILDQPVGLNFNLDLTAPPELPDSKPSAIAHKVQPPAPPPIHPPPLQKSSVAPLEDVGSYALAEMQKYFDQSMVLMFHNGALEAWKTGANWKPNLASPNKIDLTQPSIFRIVAESKKPFHGPIVPNATNNAFFIYWNEGKTPEHVTLAPILIAKNISGMILGTCPRAKASTLKLHEIEQFANELGQRLLAQRQAPKAA